MNTRVFITVQQEILLQRPKGVAFAHPRQCEVLVTRHFFPRIKYKPGP